MIIKEEQRDLFTLPHGYWFAHCISADFALGAGIAKQFHFLYDMKSKLQKVYGEGRYSSWNWEDLGPACLSYANVMNLVTKERCFHKPTLDSLRTALEDMKHCCEEWHVTMLAMPRIGCGLDRLNWEDVRPMIEEIFADMDIEILVCVL
jgi:hypothetical protein